MSLGQVIEFSYTQQKEPTFVGSQLYIGIIRKCVHIKHSVKSLAIPEFACQQ